LSEGSLSVLKHDVLQRDLNEWREHVHLLSTHSCYQTIHGSSNTEANAYIMW
jgi:hypothetical protein